MPIATIAAEPVIRLSCFLGVLVLMALWELLAPPCMISPSGMVSPAVPCP
jgi:hypothetical protein